MKHLLVRNMLSVSLKISEVFQFGNVHKKSPVLLQTPSLDNEYNKSDHPSDLKVWTFDNAICSGMYGGAVITKSNETYSDLMAFPWGNRLHPIRSFFYIGRNNYNVDKAVFLITPEANGNYYHWMIDLLPRLMSIFVKYPEEVHKRTIILHPLTKTYEKDTLAVLGIKTANLIELRSNQLSTIRSLLIPELKLNNDVPIWKKELLVKFKNLLIKEETYKKVDKIYLLRGTQRKRNLIGEERLVQILKVHGFKIINPANLTLSEQAFTLSRANVVIALHGAALTNIIFCKVGTTVVELRSSYNAPEFYRSIAKSFSLIFKEILLRPSYERLKPNKANKQDLHLNRRAIDEILTIINTI